MNLKEKTDIEAFFKQADEFSEYISNGLTGKNVFATILGTSICLKNMLRVQNESNARIGRLEKEIIMSQIEKIKRYLEEMDELK